MDTVRTMVRTPRAALRSPRFLAALALAAALVALPSVRPEDASALRMSERAVNRICLGAGGSVNYSFVDPDFGEWWMTCTFPSGQAISCGGGPGTGGYVECP
jgi:hypothetical protein